MTGPRYKVSTVEGYLTSREGHSDKRPGLSAHVLDTWYAHRVIATFRSETRLWRPTSLGYMTPLETRGKKAALASAQRLADTLNALDS